MSIRSFFIKTHTLSPLTTHPHPPHNTHSKLILSLLTNFTKISDGASVDWLTLINPGQPIFGDDNWTVSKRNRYPLFDNFTSARLVKSKDTIIKVICTITQSTLKSPIFSCKCYKYIPEENSFECQHYFFLSLLKITPLVNNLLERIGADSKRRWPGFDFFGFNLKNVRIILDKYIDDRNNKTNETSFLTQISPAEIFNSVASQNVPSFSNSDIEFNGTCNWLGVYSYGRKVNDATFKTFWERTIKGCTIYLPLGFTSKRNIKVHHNDLIYFKDITCTISGNGCRQEFICSVDEREFPSYCPTLAMKKVFQFCNFKTSKNMSGFEFFGFQRLEVIRKLTIKEISRANMDTAITDILNIHQRNAGPTSNMTSSRIMNKRNEKIHKIVELSSFGDSKSYVSYLIENFPEMVLKCINENQNCYKEFAKNIKRQPKDLNESDSSLLLMSCTSLTQREFNNVRDVLKKHNVNISSYNNVSAYIKSLDVGKMVPNFCSCLYKCMSTCSDALETLQSLISSAHWFSKWFFMMTCLVCLMNLN